MRAVLDTNVLVSGLISPTGPCGRILELVISGEVEPFADERILDEYELVIRRPALRIPELKANEFLNVLRAASQRIIAAPLLAHLPDPTDLPFLEVATAAEAVLVTGNMRHYPKEFCSAVSVVSPAEFLLLLRRPLP